MVSPVNKHGAPIEALTQEGGVILAAEDGDAITYVANGSIVEEPQGNRSPEQEQVISTRTPRTVELAGHRHAEHQSAGRHGRRRARVPVLHARSVEALVEPIGRHRLRTAARARSRTEDDVSARRRCSGTYLPLVTEANVPAGHRHSGIRIHFVSATPDLSHVVIRSKSR